MSISFADLLANTLSPVQQLREEAITKLETYSAESFPSYLGLLCQELTNETSPSHIRKSAGLMLKNALSARQLARKQELASRWLNAVDQNMKAQIKAAVIHTLGSADSSAGTVAAQIIATIADIELPIGLWDDLITTLLANITSSDSKNLKQSALQAIGFICETLDPNVLSTQANAILTAVASGIKKEEPHDEVRLAAIQALYNSLEFVKENFEKEQERNYILQMICEATQASNANIQVVAFECLVRVMNLYYEKMGIYMQQALFELTTKAMKHENDRIALQAIEFWSSICEIEYEIALENIDAQDLGEELTYTYNFAVGASMELIPILLFLLTKKEEDDDEDEFNVPMAAATCLALLSQIAADVVVEPVIVFIQANISSVDWKFREASVMSFGSILDGPSLSVLGPIVTSALPSLVPLMKDPVVHIRDTTAWTLGRISEILVQYMAPNDRAAVIAAALEGLQDSSRVAISCAWCLSNLAESLAVEDIDEPYELVPYFEAMVTALMTAAEKRNQDGAFPATAYNAISSLVSGANRECFPVIKSLVTMGTLERLDQTIAMHAQLVGADERRMLYDLQSNLCSVLVSVIRKLGLEILPISDKIVENLLSIMATAGKSSTVLEDAFLAVGALATSIEGEFQKYMNDFTPYIHNALANHEEYQLCSIAIGLVGDICRALNENMAPYCLRIMELLGQDLRSDTAKHDIKPAILSCFGDIALAICGNFETFLAPSMNSLSEAAMSVQTIDDDSEMYDLSLALREGIIEAYVGIAQGLKSGGKSQCLLQYVQFIFSFAESCANILDRSDTATRGLVGLIGDLADSFPSGELKPLFFSPWIESLLVEVKKNPHASMQTREVAKWTREMVKRQASM